MPNNLEESDDQKGYDNSDQPMSDNKGNVNQQQFSNQQQFAHQPRPYTRKPGINKEKKKKSNQDPDFPEVAQGLYELILELNKHCKVKNKKHFKNNRKQKNENQLPGQEALLGVDPTRKKQKLMDRFGENDLSKKQSIDTENDLQSQNNNENKLMQEEVKAKAQQKGELYRFKDEINKRENIQNLNMFLQKDNKKTDMTSILEQASLNQNTLLKNLQKQQLGQNQVGSSLGSGSQNPQDLSFLLGNFANTQKNNTNLNDLIKQISMGSASGNIENASINQYLMVNNLLSDNYPGKVNVLDKLLQSIGMKPQSSTQISNQLGVNNLQSFGNDLRMIFQSNPSLLSSLPNNAITPQLLNQLQQFKLDLNLNMLGANSLPGLNLAQQNKINLQQLLGGNSQLSNVALQNAANMLQGGGSLNAQSLLGGNQQQNLQNLSQQLQLNQQQQSQQSTSNNNQNNNTLNQNQEKNFYTPFKRAATHVAIAYFIFIKSFENEDLTKIKKERMDPTYNARKLREQKNPSSPKSSQQSFQQNLEQFTAEQQILLQQQQLKSAKAQQQMQLDKQANQQKLQQQSQQQQQQQQLFQQQQQQQTIQNQQKSQQQQNQVQQQQQQNQTQQQQNSQQKMQQQQQEQQNIDKSNSDIEQIKINNKNEDDNIKEEQSEKLKMEEEDEQQSVQKKEEENQQFNNEVQQTTMNFVNQEENQQPSDKKNTCMEEEILEKEEDVMQIDQKTGDEANNSNQLKQEQKSDDVKEEEENIQNQQAKGEAQVSCNQQQQLEENKIEIEKDAQQQEMQLQQNEDNNTKTSQQELQQSQQTNQNLSNQQQQQETLQEQGNNNNNNNNQRKETQKYILQSDGNFNSNKFKICFQKDNNT